MFRVRVRVKVSVGGSGSGSGSDSGSDSGSGKGAGKGWIWRDGKSVIPFHVRTRYCSRRRDAGWVRVRDGVGGRVRVMVWVRG